MPSATTPAVILKFSGANDSPTAQRWRDLLVCEQVAGEALGSDAARTRLLAFAGRHFLKSERLDRIGMQGRRGVSSLECANAGQVGEPSNDLTRVATALSRLGLLPAADLLRVAERQIFGRLIGNSDMHGGNLGFFVGPAGFSLAPSHEQLPMRYTPQPGGDVAAPPLTPELPLPVERKVWRRSARRALDFWPAASANARISEEVRTLCARSANALGRAIELAWRARALEGDPCRAGVPAQRPAGRSVNASVSARAPARACSAPAVLQRQPAIVTPMPTLVCAWL